MVGVVDSSMEQEQPPLDLGGSSGPQQASFNSIQFNSIQHISFFPFFLDGSVNVQFPNQLLLTKSWKKTERNEIFEPGQANIKMKSRVSRLERVLNWIGGCLVRVYEIYLKK